MTTILTISFPVQGQAQSEVALIRGLAGFMPASDFMRPRNDFAVNLLELRLRLLNGELLVSARLLKDFPSGCDPAKRAALCDGFDIGIEEVFSCVEVMRRDCLDEPTCTREVHGATKDTGLRLPEPGRARGARCPDPNPA
jgi:hypothetical protein